MAETHPLEGKYGLTGRELLDAIDCRFRLKVALEGAVAELQMAKKIRPLVGSIVDRFELHDLDGHPDFSIWLPGRMEPLFAECKNVRESGKPGGEAYRSAGKIVAYKVETQKTRAATGDPTSRYYDITQYHILGVCLGKKVLQAYSKDMQRLIKRGIKQTKRPSGHNIKSTFAADKGGSIPANLIECGNNESNSRYIRESKRLGQKVHPARFPAELPRFFIQFLTEQGDLVLDPFAGSNTTGAVAEELGRRWIAIERDEKYARESELRFEEPQSVTHRRDERLLFDLSG